MSEERVGIRFGAMADPITKQLKGLAPHYQLKSLDKFADAIVLLSVHSVLSESETRKARMRILKTAIKAIEKHRPNPTVTNRRVGSDQDPLEDREM